MSKKESKPEWTETERAEIAERLKKIRGERGHKSARAACEAFGWSYNQYSKHENGQRIFSPKDAIAYEKAFSTTLKYLYFGGRNEEIARNVCSPVKMLPLFSLLNFEVFEQISSGKFPGPSREYPVFSHDSDRLEDSIIVEMHDISMLSLEDHRSIEPGSKVLVDLTKKHTPSKLVLAIIPSEKTAMLRIYREIARTSDHSITYDLLPLNNDFRKIRVSDPCDTKIIGTCKRVYQEKQLS